MAARARRQDMEAAFIVLTSEEKPDTSLVRARVHMEHGIYQRQQGACSCCGAAVAPLSARPHRVPGARAYAPARSLVRSLAHSFALSPVARRHDPLMERSGDG